MITISMMASLERVFPEAPKFNSLEEESTYYAQIIQKNRKTKDHTRDAYRASLLQQCANA